MITKEIALEVFETIERMLAMTDKLEAKTGARDWGFVTIPGVAQVLGDILNDPETLATVVEDFSASHPPKMFIEDFNDRTSDLDVPYTDEGVPRFAVADIYGDAYEGIEWFDAMTNEECGCYMPPVIVNVEYDCEEFNPSQLSFEEITD